MKTNEYKEELCNKYKEYLLIIDKIGNKIMFQRQLIELAVLLNVAQDKYKVIKVINELVSGEIIKRTHFGSKKTQILIFKKYAIRFLKGLNSSQEIGAVPKVTTNSRYWESFLKVEVILEIYIPQMHEQQIDLNLNNLLEFLKFSTILLSKNDGAEFYKNLMEDNNINKDVINEHLKILKMERNNILKNLNKKQQQDNDERKKNNRKRKDKWDFLSFSTVNTLLRRNIYILSIYKNDKNTIGIDCIWLDVNNTQNFEKGITNLAITYNFLSKLFNKKIKLNYMMIVQNKIARINIKRDCYKQNDILKKLKISELDWSNFTVMIGTLKEKLQEIEITEI